jgi:hypothetical protein
MCLWLSKVYENDSFYGHSNGVKAWLSRQEKYLVTKNYKYIQKIFDALKVEILFYSTSD